MCLPSNYDFKNYYLSISRTGGTAHPFQLTTKHGIFWSMTGCTHIFSKYALNAYILLLLGTEYY